MSVLTYQQSVFKRYYSDKHFSEFYLQDGGKSQLKLNMEQNYVTDDADKIQSKLCQLSVQCVLVNAVASQPTVIELKLKLFYA